MIDRVMELLMKQFADVMSKDSEYYNNYHIYLSNEQQYVKDKNKIIKVPLERSKLRDASLDIINEKIKDILSIDCDISQLINV